MKGQQIHYSEAELGWIKAHCEWPRAKAHAAFVERFNRHDVVFDNFKALCTRRGWKTGRTGRFEKGQEAHNKGKPFAGAQHPNSRKHQFRKGARQGVAVKLYKPIGTERVSKDGYVERKIHDGMPMQSRWRAVHLIRWEAVNGPVPKGHALKCLDGNKRNTEPSNWEAIPRSLLPKLNARWGGVAFDHAEPELKRTIMATAKLDYAIRQAKKQRKAQ